MGPLEGVRVVEMVGSGPGPFARMLLADMGADVLQVDRPVSVSSAAGALARGKRKLTLDLMRAGGVDVLLALAFGIACALAERAVSGRGQVVDAAMVDGAALLLAPFYAGRTSGAWGPRGTNLLDGAAHFYDVYECADGRWLAIAAIEPQFYAELLKGPGLDEDPDAQYDRERWPAMKARIAAVVATRTRDDWVTAYDGLDACVAPVLAPDEAPHHPHAIARRAFVRGANGLPQPAPAPRFSRTPPATPPDAVADGADGTAVLAAWGVEVPDLDARVADGTVGPGRGPGGGSD